MSESEALKPSALDYERAYFERGFIAAAAWSMTSGEGQILSDAVIDHAWAHRDEGMDSEDLLPVRPLPLPTAIAGEDEAREVLAGILDFNGRPKSADAVRDGSDLIELDARQAVRAMLAFTQQAHLAQGRGVEGTRWGSPPEPVANPSADWCDAYADWYHQGRG